MKTIYTNIFVVGVMLSIFACSDFLDQVPDEKLSEKILFDTREDAGRVLTQLYTYQNDPININPSSYYSAHPGKAADELDVHWTNYGYFAKDQGKYSASSPIFNSWQIYYEGIRYCLYFLSRIDECKDPKLSEQERTWWKGEANFLQAWYYFHLLETYGPIPILNRVYQPNEINNVVKEGIPRATLNECVHHIDSLAEKAAEQLDLYYTSSGLDRAGRASKVAARQLQSRLWLYAASPLYNGMVNPISGKSYKNLCPKSKSGAELMNTNYDKNLWNKAKNAALLAIETANSAQRVLHKPENKSGYYCFAERNTPNRLGEPQSEIVFYHQSWNASEIVTSSLPISWGKWAGYGPTLEHVNEYFMANGLLPEDDEDYNKITSITQKESYNANGKTFNVPLKYKNRDPRFYLNILFPGQYSYAVLGNEIENYNTRWADNGSSSYTDYIWYRPWYDGPDGLLNMAGRNYTNVGMQIIKWVPKRANKNDQGAGDIAIPTMRVDELYLNYAEASLELAIAEGRDPSVDKDVFEYWDKIRERVQVPDIRKAYAKANIPLTPAKLRQLIRREREIELAFEGHRYFDNRRWLIAEREGGAKHAFNINETETNGFWNDNFVFEVRAWDDKMYFMPILRTELDKNPQLSQNQGW